MKFLYIESSAQHDQLINVKHIRYISRGKVTAKIFKGTHRHYTREVFINFFGGESTSIRYNSPELAHQGFLRILFFISDNHETDRETVLTIKE